MHVIFNAAFFDVVGSSETVCVCVDVLNVLIATITSFRTMRPLFLACFAAICCMAILRETSSVSFCWGRVVGGRGGGV